jgi:GntR family transcriptional repressor for pyruvate dehydrogenase complex
MMTAFPKLDRKLLPEMVADAIEDAILQRAFPVGSQLPSEQDLARQFAVSRNVVREAFKFLKERGLIEIHNGSGAYVLEPSSAATSNALGRYIRLLGEQQNLEALYEARRVIEGANARMAAERADDNDLRVLGDCLARMADHAGSIERWSEADLEFHLAVARATHNPYLTVLVEPLVGQLRRVIAEGYVIPGAAERGLGAHTRLYHCIRDRDAEGAYQAILEHLQDSEARLQKVNDQKFANSSS